MRRGDLQTLKGDAASTVRSGSRDVGACAEGSTCKRRCTTHLHAFIIFVSAVLEQPGNVLLMDALMMPLVIGVRAGSCNSADDVPTSLKLTSACGMSCNQAGKRVRRCFGTAHVTCTRGFRPQAGFKSTNPRFMP